MTDGAVDDIKVIRGEEVKAGGDKNVGVFAWRVPSLGLSGFSRQPLLDACLAIKRAGADQRRHVAMYREGRSTWDKRCSVEWGAGHRVNESQRDGLRFCNYDAEAPAARFAEEAAE